MTGTTYMVNVDKLTSSFRNDQLKTLQWKKVMLKTWTQCSSRRPFAVILGS